MVVNKIFGNARYIIVFLVVVLSFSTVLFFDAKILNDGDVFMHVAVGQWILQHLAVPHVDPFSYSFLGAPWVAHEWLAETLMGLAYNWGGWSAVLVLTGLAFSSAMGGVAMFVTQRGGSLLAVSLTLFLSCFLTLPFLLVRPHILALPCFVWWSICLLRAREKGNAPPSWPTVLILLVWANLHGSFAMGLLLVLPFAFEAVWAEKQSRLHVLGAWLRFLLLSCVAVSITANGWRGLLFPVQLIMMPQLAMINEWQPMQLQWDNSFLIACCAFIYVVITRRVKIPFVRWVLLIGFVYCSIKHVRYELLTVIFAPLILAGPLGQMAQEQPQGQIWLRVSTIQWSVLVLAVGMLTGLRMVCPFVLTDRSSAPVSALAHVPAELRKQPVLNSYGLGGILMLEGIRPNIDGRADMYGYAFMQEQDALMGGDKAALQAWSTEFGVQWAFLMPTEKLVNVLDSDPQWRRLYTDRYAIVYVKEKFVTPFL